MRFDLVCMRCKENERAEQKRKKQKKISSNGLYSIATLIKIIFIFNTRETVKIDFSTLFCVTRYIEYECVDDDDANEQQQQIRRTY